MNANMSAIISELVWLYHVNRQPVPTKILADLVGYSERHMRRKLNYLRDKGILGKNGKRGGWYLTGEALQAIKYEATSMAMAV